MSASSVWALSGLLWNLRHWYVFFPCKLFSSQVSFSSPRPCQVPSPPVLRPSPQTMISRRSSRWPLQLARLQTADLSLSRIQGYSSLSEMYFVPYVSFSVLTSLQLPYRVRWQDLKDLFRRAGTVLRADVSLGPDNRSRGYGTVLLATADDAGRAIDMFHGYSWQTRILEVRPDRLPQDLDNPLPAPPSNTLSIPAPFSASSSASPLTSATHLTSPCRTARVLSDDLDFTTPFGSEATNTSSSACRNLFVGNVSSLDSNLSKSSVHQMVLAPFSLSVAGPQRPVPTGRYGSPS